MHIRLTLPFPPSLNMMYPTNKQGRRYLSDRGQMFKKDAQAVLLKNKKKLQGDLAINIALFRPRKSGDIDNYIKPILDCMKGYVFDDDKQFRQLRVVIADDKEEPRVEVEIYQI